MSIVSSFDRGGPEDRMSAVGQGQLWRSADGAAGVPPASEIIPRVRDLRFVPNGDMDACRVRVRPATLQNRRDDMRYLPLAVPKARCGMRSTQKPAAHSATQQPSQSILTLLTIIYGREPAQVRFGNPQ